MKGITVVLHERSESGRDGFNNPVYSETEVLVEDVLIGSPTEQEIVNDLNLYQKKAIYTLGIPEGDTHSWEAGTIVEFFGQKWRTIGHPIEGIKELIPLRWKKNVRVEAYE